MSHAFPLRGKVLVAYLTLCATWGSTFLANRIGVQHLPPALFAGVRFLVAGCLLLAITLALGLPLPSRGTDWGAAAIAALLLLVGGNGLLVAGAQFVESGTMAVFVVGGALCIAVLDAVVPGSEARVTWSQLGGLIVGCLGALLLVGADLDSLRRADWRGPGIFAAANVCWAAGAVYTKRHPVTANPYVHSALQMLIGGLVLTAVGTAVGEWQRFDPSPAGLGAIAYLIVIGSIVGYSCFFYVLRHTPPTIAATYVYVNTVVAVLLGWVVLGERITARTVVAVVTVLGAVIWVQRAGTGRGLRK
ncbi:MAG: EamA family transporter [Gemmatimonadetes bacterium]|nr:EamA family transporter [Gemmatimonadota bacterium]